jgi:methyl-accepting chemotaxis protein
VLKNYGLRSKLTVAFGSILAVAVFFNFLALMQLSQVSDQIGNSDQTFLGSSLNFTRTALLAGDVLSIIMSVVACGLLMREISRPISRIAEAMGLIAGGDMSMSTPELCRKDEIGDLARAVELLRAKVIADAKLEEEASAERHFDEREREGRDAVDRANSVAIAQATAQLAQGLLHLAKSDFTIPLQDKFPPQLEDLRIAYNVAVSELAKTNGSVPDPGTKKTTGPEAQRRRTVVPKA